LGLLAFAPTLGLAQPSAAPATASPAPALAPAAPAPAPAAAPAAAEPAAKSKPAGPAGPPAAKPAAATPAQAPAGKPAAATGAAAAASGSTSPAAPAADRPALPRVVDNIQKVYERTANLKARFAQTLQSAMGKRQASGILRLKKPGKMRWDYEKPEKKLFVTDGAMLWMYEPEDEQAFRQPLNSSQLPAQVSFLFGKGRLSDEFDITYLDGQKLGQPGDLVLKLVPKKATAQYKHLVFVVDPASFMVKETVLYDQQGGTNHIVFSAIETNLKADIDDSRFTFTPPPNTKIINPR
jgi:outer membrane lipoprotein carrier protein